MLNANVEITHNRLVTLENRTSMMVKAIMLTLKDLKSHINKINLQLASQYRMMSSTHNRFTLQTDAQNSNYTSFCPTTVQELFNHTSRHVTKNTQTIYKI